MRHTISCRQRKRKHPCRWVTAIGFGNEIMRFHELYQRVLGVSFGPPDVILSVGRMQPRGGSAKRRCRSFWFDAGNGRSGINSQTLSVPSVPDPGRLTERIQKRCQLFPTLWDGPIERKARTIEDSRERESQ